jgi:hypothetical protein
VPAATNLEMREINPVSKGNNQRRVRLANVEGKIMLHIYMYIYVI